MKTFGFVLAAALAAGIALPSIASAKTIVIKRDGPRAEMRHGGRDHGWRHNDRKVIVINRGGHRY